MEIFYIQLLIFKMNKTKKLIKEVQILKEEVVNLKQEIEALKFLYDLEKLKTPKLGFDFDKKGFII